MCLCLGRKLEEAGEGHEFSVFLGDEGFRYQLYCDSIFFSSIMLYNESWWLLKPWWEEAVWNQDWEAVETKVWQLFYVAVPFSAKALSITPTHSTCSLRLTCQFLPALLVPSVCLWNSCLITCNVNHLFLPCLTAPWVFIPLQCVGAGHQIRAWECSQVCFIWLMAVSGPDAIFYWHLTQIPVSHFWDSIVSYALFSFVHLESCFYHPSHLVIIKFQIFSTF